LHPSVKIGDHGFWWCLGWIIEAQEHPLLLPYTCYRDTDTEEDGEQDFGTVRDAVQHAIRNPFLAADRNLSDYGHTQARRVPEGIFRGFKWRFDGRFNCYFIEGHSVPQLRKTDIYTTIKTMQDGKR
jgi:hypothetical protein